MQEKMQDTTSIPSVFPQGFTCQNPPHAKMWHVLKQKLTVAQVEVIQNPLPIYVPCLSLIFEFRLTNLAV